MEHRNLRVAAGAGIAAILFWYFNSFFFKIQVVGIGTNGPPALIGGLLSLLLVWFLFIVITGDYRIWNIAVGKDGRASTSKFQVLLWFGVVLFAYVTFETIRQTNLAAAIAGTEPFKSNLEALRAGLSIPPNVAIILGISTVNGIAAKGIAASNAAPTGTVKVASGEGLKPLMLNDDGTPDFGKIQLLAWTFVGLGTFVAGVSQNLNATVPAIQDVDPAIMALMGFGSAAYLGNKLISTATPYLASISGSGSAKPGDDVTLTGANLGTSGAILLDIGQVTTYSAWSDSSVTFKVPLKRADNSDWPRNTPLPVKVSGTKGTTANALQLTITD